jgi:hypothetical protein
VAVVVDPDVRRLQVAMDDAARVGMLEGAGEVRCDLDGPCHLEVATRRDEQALDVAPGHVAADDEGVAVVLAGVEDGDDVSVVAEFAHRIRLSARSGLDRCARAGRVVERNGHLVAGSGVVSQVDALAPGLAEEAPHHIAARDLSRNVGRERLGRGRQGRGLFGDKLGSAGVAEPRALTILVPT